MRKFKPLQEKISVYVAKSPSRAVLFAILLFNLAFLFVSAFIISTFAPESLEHSGFWASVFYTVTMMLDSGSIQMVVADVGKTGVAIIIICLIIVMIGMITFTGAVIGYITNYISNFIENANAGIRKLRISGHTVILNWNSRASEIINEMIYSREKEKVVVLVPKGKETVEREISDRVSDTISRERKMLEAEAAAKGMSKLKTRRFLRESVPKNNLTVIVREGEIYSTKQLTDISVEEAKSVIILGRDINMTNNCAYKLEEKTENYSRGNSNIIKTLIQVADITSAENSADNQKIVVEVEDNWTLELVRKIIVQKEKHGKCNIVPVPVNQILGQILSQFSIMPELNPICSELFSNKGAYFASRPVKEEDRQFERYSEYEYIESYLCRHAHAVPLTTVDTEDGKQGFYMTMSMDNVKRVYHKKDTDNETGYTFKLNKDFWLKKKNIIIMGHNSKMASVMDGFSSFRGEWNFKNGDEILNIMVIDDKNSLEKINRFKDYPYVTKVVEADLYEKEKIYDAIISFVSANKEKTSILILSDDMAVAEEIDETALTNLIYISDIIEHELPKHSEDVSDKVDVIVEVLNPRNYDVVCSYSVDNIVISNRYISKMITQIGEHDAIYDFYVDILTYDSDDESESKELYIKRAGDFFEEIPPECTAYELIRGVFDASKNKKADKAYASHENTYENRNIVMGYISSSEGDKRILFTGNQKKIKVKLNEDDRLIIFSKH